MMPNLINLGFGQDKLIRNMKLNDRLLIRTDVLDRKKNAFLKTYT